ncbi:DEDD exonuclease domain-containing protein [Ruania halotolerans]|uniref:DEDD exonuclease domain-containing protein n=1 Tax=Ruania halotolerans TaxID=2897773 RepID=UPI001E4B57E4|nr:DEDD exonuclease domain-containing protein [Ruania halotolerans]UFU04828.1 DEDD exonuclease domain-containing protein [Ruania halotolerans]
MAENLLHPPRPGRRLPRADDPAQPGSPGAREHPGTPLQLGLDELGTALIDATFVVVDLETTGGSPRESAITEIGAVKVRGGEVLGEFQTLVNPGIGIPPTITVLTGITNAMVMTAPPINEVLPAFLEFARGAILVAHNARFDVGFLRAASARMDLVWPRPQVVDTVALARRVVTRDEAPNHKLSTLAPLFGSPTAPDHRALTDARATVDVLHALLGRMTALGVTHVEDLATAADPVPARRRRKATLADDLPTGPGVYHFLGPGGEVLYIGTAVNLRRRVRSYFTAAEKRARIAEMVDLATSVRPIPCATALEASVRELRGIAEHHPPYNRRSRSPEKQPWVRLTDEAHPRLSVVRTVPPEHAGQAIGPFTSRAQAELAVSALVAATGLRTCTTRLARTPTGSASACVLAEMGKCLAPCVHEAPQYSGRVLAAQRALSGDASAVVATARVAIARLAAQQRYEEAAVRRDQLVAYLRAASRTERHSPLHRAPQVIAARRHADGGWELVLIRHGRLAGTTVSRPGAPVMAVVAALADSGEQVPAAAALGGAATAEETELVLRWLETPGTRLVEATFADSDGGWSVPLRGATAHLPRLAERQVRETENRALGTPADLSLPTAAVPPGRSTSDSGAA